MNARDPRSDDRGRPTNLSVPGHWGGQTLARWGLGELGPRPVASLERPPTSVVQAGTGCWRVSVDVQRTVVAQGDAPTLTATWGAGVGSSTLAGILLPAVLVVPGSLTLVAELVVAATAPLSVVSKATPVFSGCCEQVLTVLDAQLLPQALPPTGYRVTAVSAGVQVSPFGAPAPIALPLGQSIEIAGPGALVAGVVYVHHRM